MSKNDTTKNKNKIMIYRKTLFEWFVVVTFQIIIIINIYIYYYYSDIIKWNIINSY